MFWRNLYSCSQKVKEAALYKTLVRPKMEYYSITWDALNLEHINYLEQFNAELLGLSAKIKDIRAVSPLCLQT